MRRLLVASFVMWALGCEYDSACKAVMAHAPGLNARLMLGEAAVQPTEIKEPLTRTLTPQMAERLLAVADAIEVELPAAARADDLNVILQKLADRRAAFEQALRDFLAIDPGQLDKGLDSGATMPLRRGVEMSRDAMLTLANHAIEICRMHE